MRIIRNIAALVVLIPFMPFMIINGLGVGLVKFSDWCCEKKWADRLLTISDDLVR
jgi:hypothetical protein